MAIVLLTKDLKNLPEQPEFTDKEIKVLKKGDFVKKHERYMDDTGNSAGRGMAYMIVDQPPQKVWNQILDFESYPKFFPSIAKSKIYQQDEGEIFVDFTLKVSLLLKINYHTHHSFFPDQSRMTWKMDQSKKNGFKEATGSWTVWPYVNGNSLVGYSISLEAGRAVPKMIEDLLAQSGLNRVMENLRKRVHKIG